jgi:hypothetical protein
VVADARPRSTAIASSSGPHTKLAAASPPLLSRVPPGAPITTSEATTSARRPAAARSRPSSSAESPARDVEPTSSDEMASGNDSAAWIVGRVRFLGVGRARGGEHERVERAPDATASRLASTAIDTESSS